LRTKPKNRAHFSEVSYQGVRLIGENRTEYYVDARGGYCKHCPYDVPPKLAEGGDTFGRKGKH